MVSSFKYAIGDLVYAYDTYRGIIGIVEALHEGTETHPWPFYSLKILKKTQPTFYVKRWDNESFSEGEIQYVKFWDKNELTLWNKRVVDIMSDEDIINFQANNYPRFTKLINPFTWLPVYV